MKNIKDITLSIFAIIGFISIITAFNTQTQQQTHGTPESHVWEIALKESSNVYFLYNKVTGELRSYDIVNTGSEKKAILRGEGNEIVYRSAYEVANKEID